MSELHIRQIPPQLHRRLREQAHAEGRSMSAEAIVLLRQALHAADDQPARQRAAIDRLHEIQRQNRLPRRARPAQQVVREDRDASR